MDKLSVVIICKNEEQNIRRCLESVKWADEIVVYDSGSTDKTIEICNEYSCAVFHNKSWEGFGKAKREAVNLAQNDWIFSIDADEEVSEGLKKTIVDIIAHTDSLKAYRIKRDSFYMGKMIKYSGWQRDYTLRLFNRKNGNFNLKIIHESVEVDCKIGRIYEVIYHYTYPFIKTHFTKMISYSELGAISAYQKKKQSSICKAYICGVAKFIKMYIINLGFLDGKVGIVLALNSSIGVYMKYIYLWEQYVLDSPLEEKN